MEFFAAFSGNGRAKVSLVPSLHSKEKCKPAHWTNIWGVGETVANLQVFLWGLGLLLVLVNLEGPKIQSMVMDINIYEFLKNVIDKRTLKKTHHFSSLVQLKTGQQSLSERMF